MRTQEITRSGAVPPSALPAPPRGAGVFCAVHGRDAVNVRSTWMDDRERKHWLEANARGNSWERESIRVVLRNPAYIGQVSSGRTSYPGNHEPLVSQELWESCRLKRERRTSNKTTRHTNTTALLNDIAFCDICQNKLWHRASNGRPYYRCSGKDKRVHEARSVPSRILEAQLAELVAGLSLPPDMIDDVIRRAREIVYAKQAEAPRPHNSPDSIRERLKRLGLVYANGDINANTYDEKRRQLQAELSEAEACSGTALHYTVNEERARRLLSNLGETWAIADRNERRAILFGLFQKLFVEEREITAAVVHQDIYTILVATAGVTCVEWGV